jgi:hypothetical protein
VDGWRCRRQLGEVDVAAFCSGVGGAAVRVGDGPNDWRCN